MKKQLTTAAVILAMFAAPAMANGMDNQAFENQVFHTQADVPVQLAELSTQEMKETEGAWVANAIGGLAGMYGGGYGYLASGGRDPKAFFGSAMGGAAAGVFSPVIGIRSGAIAVASGFAGGFVGSRASR